MGCSWGLQGYVVHRSLSGALRSNSEKPFFHEPKASQEGGGFRPGSGARHYCRGQTHPVQSHGHVSYNLNSLKQGHIGDYIGEYYRGY